MTVSQKFHNVPNSGNPIYIISQADLVFPVAFAYPSTFFLSLCYYLSLRLVVRSLWCEVVGSRGVTCSRGRTTVVSVDSRCYVVMANVRIGANLSPRLLESLYETFTASICLRVGWSCYVKLDITVCAPFLKALRHKVWATICHDLVIFS
jgi:hypothetical protein